MFQRGLVVDSINLYQLMEESVLPFSSEWIYVTFRLQMLLAHPNIQLVALRKRAPVFPSAFDNYLKIEAAVDATGMDQPSLDSIKSSLKRDLPLRAGRTPQDPSPAKDQKRHRMLLLKVAIFQILPALREPSLSPQDFLLHYPDYDSIYAASRQQELALFSHEYLVRDAQQYQWEYDAEYVYTEWEEWSAEGVVCENCKLVAAKCYCPEDRESYCWPCFGDLHRSDRKAKHRREPLSPYNCPPRCLKSLHGGEGLTHYCFHCKQLKCSACLQDGQHRKKAGPGEGEHETIQGRQLVVLFREKEQQMLGELKVKLSALIREVQAKITLISGHYDLRLKQFARWFEEKAGGVKEWAVRQLNLATGLHSELKRKYDEVLWLESYSGELQERCRAQQGMQVKQGISLYMSRAFSQDYFQKFDRRVQELKIFNS